MTDTPTPAPVTAGIDGAQIMTVLGPIGIDRMGVTLPHEHVLVDFVGAEHVSPERYDADEAYAVILPHLEEAVRHGVQSFVECTPSYIGRDSSLVRRLAEATGLHMLVSTGYYGARAGAFLPAHAYRETARELSDRWVDEWVKGIGDSGVRPGFIKTAVNPAGTLSEMDRKLIRAAAQTHLRTGLTIASHTGVGPVFAEIEELRAEGVDPAAFIWVHANHDPDMRRHVAAARLGAWVEFDGVTADVDADVVRITNMREHGLLDRVLLSHDNGWYEPGNPERRYKGYGDLFDHLLPALGASGLSDAEIKQLVVLNPAAAFALRVRPVASRRG